MTDTRTTATDHPTTLPVDAMRTTDTDNPTSVEVETEQAETEQLVAHRIPTLSFADPFDEQLEAGQGTTIRVPELVNVMLGMNKRPDAVSLRVDHPERMTLTVYAINGQAVKPPIDLKERAEVIEDGEHGTLFVFDIGAEAKLPIDVWLGAVGGPVQFTGTYVASEGPLTVSDEPVLTGALEVVAEPSVPEPTAVLTPAVDVIPSAETVDQAVPATHPNPRPIPSAPAEKPRRRQRPGALPERAGAVRVLGQSGAIEPVPESEANAQAGLQPHPSEGERHIRLILVGAAKATLHALIDSIDERTAARTLSQIGKTALDLRKTLARFGAHAFPEEEVLSRSERKMRRYGMASGGRMNRETMGVTAIKEMVGAFSTFTKPAELDKTISSLAAMKKIDDPEGKLTGAIAQLEQRVVDLTAAVATDPGIDADKAASALGTAMTGADPDAWEGGGLGLGQSYGQSYGMGDSDDYDDDDEDYEDDEDGPGFIAMPVAYTG